MESREKSKNLLLTILIEINGEFFNKFMNITEEDEWFRVWKTKTFEEILYLDGVIAIRLLLNNLFDSSELVAFSSSFNVLEVDILVFSWIDDLAQEHKYTVPGANLKN